VLGHLLDGFRKWGALCEVLANKQRSLFSAPRSAKNKQRCKKTRYDNESYVSLPSTTINWLSNLTPILEKLFGALVLNNVCRMLSPTATR
jgi:hypothetical protein